MDTQECGHMWQPPNGTGSPAEAGGEVEGCAAPLPSGESSHVEFVLLVCFRSRPCESGAGMERDSPTPWEFNGSFHQPAAFLMMGIPGLEALHPWVSIPFCALYLTALLGNCVILFIIRRTPSLHEPMYYFLSMLAVTDLGLALCTLPTTLGLFWFNVRRIGFDACLTQMYFIHILSFIESSVLLAMAFDRFIAISHPLRHAAILTKSTVLKIGLAIVLRGTVSLLPVPFLLRRLTYCGRTELSHSFCFHPDIMNLACADIKVNVFYGMIILLSTVGMDFIFIVLSYILIIRTVVSLTTKEECLKALNTCVSHICAVLVFFIPMIGLSMIHRFGKDVPPLVNTAVAYTYLTIPPALNPVIYSVKSTHIREALLRALRRTRGADC
ncbi:olfactory receptor 51G2-like [Cyanistes caeruleus]|uniref:olfactory receptor 51G2-like n=1 Tax=Cyanistes caeruleus TaxID=156563 RepID=UPI000CDB9173|nr:olfactory receptor 51G2-like [Cyanistes caeruleus]